MTPMILLTLPLLCPAQDVIPEPPETPWGHSSHGAAYDEGPRQRPWPMPGVGKVHFPISTTHPEVQAWFDQGVAHLHGFWYHEAERAFRWCAKLDPDCAMAYWGLARSVQMGPKRSEAFLEQAEALADGANEREQLFIEIQRAIQDTKGAGGPSMGPSEDDEERERARERVAELYQRLIMEYPDDVEAKAFYFVDVKTIRPDDKERVGIEAILQDVLDAAPDHVGAHHYRVHLWDGENGRYAIDSCQTLSEVAPDSGHLQHMPGHVLSSIGMWHEAAIAMDSATRVEKEYMKARRIVPEDNWDYIHNLDYLIYIQEQLGMHELAILNAKQLMLSPPFQRKPEGMPPPLLAMMTMMTRGPMQRALIRARAWDEILEGSLLDWPAGAPPMMQIPRLYGETRAHLGLGDLEAAEATFERFEEALASLATPPPGMPEGEAMPPRALEFMTKRFEPVRLQLEGLLELERGHLIAGIDALTHSAELMEEDWENDPPNTADYGFNLLGDAFRRLGSHQLAAEAYERTLETVFHDGHALAGLTIAYTEMGKLDLAAQTKAALEVAWSDADHDIPLRTAAFGTSVPSDSRELPEHLAQAMSQRNYRTETLDPLGPSLYSSPQAPRLAALDSEGQSATLDDHAGKSILLVFYQGESCPHCVEQLEALNERAQAFGELGTAIVAISKDSVEKLAAFQADFEIQLLSDPKFENARRFASYDDFEEVELHSTFLIDRDGGIHWSRIGGEPFMDLEYLEREAERLGEGGLIQDLRTATAE